MAKIKARGCHAVASLTFEEGSTRRRYVLRSDGALLMGDARAHYGTNRDGSTYTTWPGIALYVAAFGTGADDCIATRTAELTAIAERKARTEGVRIITREGC